MFVFTPNLVPRCTLYPFSRVPNFKAMGLRVPSFMAVFTSVQKKEKEKNQRK